MGTCNCINIEVSGLVFNPTGCTFREFCNVCLNESLGKQKLPHKTRRIFFPCTSK